MKYMMMMNVAGGPYRISDWPKGAFRAHIGFMKEFARKLSAAGELVSAEGLSGPDQAKLVRAGQDGRPVTDGVFPETKDNPMVALNLAIATAMVDGPAAGLARLDAVAGDPRLRGHHRVDAVRAHLLERAGDRTGAAAAYARAAERTASLPERNYLLARALTVKPA